MQELIYASIGGTAFTLEKEGYNRLRAYLGQNDNPNVEQEVSQRLMELYGNTNVITAYMIGQVIAERPTHHSATSSTPPPKGHYAGTDKKLTRRSQGAVLGGVCSGMGAYFNANPLIFRALFLFTMLFGSPLFLWPFPNFISMSGFSLVVYIVMWCVLPLDKTTSETTTSYSPGGCPKDESNSNALVAILKVVVISVAGICLALFTAAIAVASLKMTVDFNQSNTVILQFLDITSLSYPIALTTAIAIITLPALVLFSLVVGAVQNSKHTAITVMILIALWIAVAIFAITIVASHLNELSQIDFFDWIKNRSYF